MSSFLGDRPADTLSAIRQSMGAAPATPNVKQLEGSDGIVFDPNGSTHYLPAVSVRRHVFHDPQSLAGWLTDRAEPSRVETLVDETRVVAVINGGDAQHDEISCELRYHPVFDRWRASFGKWLDQKALHGLLRRTVADFKAGTAITMTNGSTERMGAGDRLLAGLSKLQVRKDQTYRQELGAKGEVTLRASDGKNEASIDLPDMFEIEVPIFVDVVVGEWDPKEPRYIIRVLVDMDLDGTTPRFLLTAPDLALQLLDARRDVARCLREKLGVAWTIGLGAAKTQVVLTAPRGPRVTPIFAFALASPPDGTPATPEISAPDGSQE